MRKTFLGIILLISLKIYSQDYKVFHTSICYDLLSSIENYETLAESSMYNFFLTNDSTYLSNVKLINETVKASNLCNLYASLPTNKDNINDCIAFFTFFSLEQIPEEFQGKYAERIFKVKDKIVETLKILKKAGYEQYWKQTVLPKMEKAINSFTFEEGLLDSIHKEITLLAGKEPLSDEYSKIYILDIGNAFNLNDETFCCTYFLLDKEIAKQYRINFIQVYIHENLHRLYLSEELMNRLDVLFTTDDFYRVNESKAEGYGEGRNEAFIVAAETYISRKLGLKKDEDVLTEFTEYADGSLVLAPIIYTCLSKKSKVESYNDFLLKLFKRQDIKSGEIEKQYYNAIKKIKINL